MASENKKYTTHICQSLDHEQQKTAILEGENE